MLEKERAVREKLAKYGQEHLLLKYDSMSEKEKETLLEQILEIDFNQILELYENTKKKIQLGEDKIEPIEYIDKNKLSESEKERYTKLGEEIIKSGKLGFITMAGGQGTRLGHNGPKGTFKLIGEKTLFELICDTLKEGKEKYGIDIPWYIMTSKENNNDTVAFFEKQNYFGYPKDCVVFFKQGELPMISSSGKILLDKEGYVKEASDGHGGIFEAIVKNNLLEDMKKRGLEWLFIGGVDNCLVKMCDPLFVGLTVDKKYMVAGKSLVKANPAERVGVFCKRNGRPSVIEYTEISKEMAEARDANGELLYGEAHVLMNMFNIKALEALKEDKLPYHSAFKKAEYYDENGNWVVPTEPNAYKFESFIFDAFSYLDNMLIMRVKREEEFAPVKNAEGSDSPETARKLYNDFIATRK
ncbi:MAG: UTP--glucose-1-phosphate uridylyltransferase [Clostridia bacterium]|nr:UTP--glucose-1-phosphate uridylyltransferase [Clostridia bacterium]